MMGVDRMLTRMTGVIAVLVLLCPTAEAQPDWRSKAQVGFVMARGNSETETANARLELVREAGNWKNTFGTSMLYGRSSDIENAGRWDAGWQTEHKVSDRFFWFGSLRYEDDRYSGFDYQAVASSGIGRDFIKSDTTILSAQLGAGYRRLRPEELLRNELGEVVDRIPGEEDSDVVGNAAVRFEYAFNDATRVLNTLIVETGSSNTLSRNELALQVQMNKTLALSLGFNVRNNSKPPENLKGTDTLTTVNLVYEVK